MGIVDVHKNGPTKLPPIPAGWEWVLVVAGAMAAFGSLLPWEQVSAGLSSFTRNGFQLGAHLSFSIDGLIVLGLGAVAALIGVTRLTGRPAPRWMNRSPIIVGAVLLFDGVINERSLASTVNGLQRQYPLGSFAVGYGVWLVIGGGALILFAGLAGWWEARRGSSATL